MTIRDEVLAALDAMDDQAQVYTLAIAQSQAARHPRPAPKPVLSLVTSDLDDRHLLSDTGSLHGVQLAARSRSPKKVK
jgi:hypothetical protein